MPSCPSCAFDAPTELQFCPRCGASLVDPLIGSVLGDRYRVISRIGVGGMGVVYRAQHTTLKRDLAVKVLLPEFGGKDEFVRRFEREAESASRLAHPHIIAVTDFGRTAEGLLFLVMEYLDGRSLTSLIREGPLEVGRAVTIVRQMLAALTRAHAAGIVHRDLKPDNIMLIDREGEHDFVKILDFGIAKVTEPEPGREALTQAGVVFGTPEYLSPEQALGDKIDARADLYATGVILFEMLTGRRPFESDDKIRIISMHLSHPVPRLRDVHPAGQVPAALEDVVRQAMEKERESRFSSAAAFLTALEDAEQLANEADGAPVTDGKATPPPALREPSDQRVPVQPAGAGGPPSRARRRKVMMTAAAVGLAIAATAVIVPLRSRPKTVATARVPRPTPPPSQLAAQLHVVEGLLSAGENVKARVALEQLMAENPGNARVRYFLGRLAFADDRHGEAIGNYREAIGLDGSFRGDPVLLEHLGVALGETKVADQALDLAIEKVGRPAVELLVKVANGNGDLRRRDRAARALDELGEGARVDLVALQMTQLKRAATCDEKKPLVVALGKAGDVRALPTLRSQRPHGGLDGLLGNDTAAGCMKTELADAITHLEAKLPPDKRPPPPPPASTKRTVARSSFFRGR